MVAQWALEFSCIYGITAVPENLGLRHVVRLFLDVPIFGHSAQNSPIWGVASGDDFLSHPLQRGVRPLDVV